MEPIIVLIILTMTYGFIEILKSYIKTEKIVTFIPILSALFGALIGIAIYFFIPQIIYNANFLEALIVGMCSGLSATGAHQITKQLQKNKINKTDTNE